jgi:uncharacterized membrane-anchored protein
MGADEAKANPTPGEVSQIAAETQDEIAQIMSEIEGLQQTIVEVPEAVASAPAPAPAVEATPVTTEAIAAAEGVFGSDHDSMEEVMGVPEPVSNVVPLSTPERAGMEKHDGNDQAGTLSMTVTGEMKLKLKYEFGGHEVTLKFGDDYLRVELSDGTEFKVPVQRGYGQHKAA